MNLWIKRVNEGEEEKDYGKKSIENKIVMDDMCILKWNFYIRQRIRSIQWQNECMWKIQKENKTTE